MEDFTKFLNNSSKKNSNFYTQNKVFLDIASCVKKPKITLKVLKTSGKKETPLFRGSK